MNTITIDDDRGETQTSGYAGAGNGGNAGRNSLSELKEDLGAVQRDLAKLKNDAVSYASTAASSVTEQMKHGSETAMDAAKKFSGQARNYHGEMCNFVKARPTASVLIALGVGAVVARLLARR